MTIKKKNLSTGRPAEEPARVAAKARQRLLVWALLISMTFFFDGCENKQPAYTLGVVPSIRVSFGDLGWGQPIHLKEAYPIGHLINLLLIGGLLFALMFGRHPAIVSLRTGLTSNFTWVAGILTVAIFNSFLYLPAIWMWCVFTPTSWIMEAFGDDPPIWICRAAGRILFAVWVLLIAGFSYGTVSLYQRYVMLDNQRWWQMKLGGLIALMVILGTLLGVVGRIALQK